MIHDRRSTLYMTTVQLIIIIIIVIFFLIDARALI